MNMKVIEENVMNVSRGMHTTTIVKTITVNGCEWDRKHYLSKKRHIVSFTKN